MSGFIKLSEGLSLPLDIATETLAIIARKGAGKTYTGRVLAEGLLGEHVQTVIVDPLDVWWGLRLGADGQGGGHNLVIIGGAHADLPLVDSAGVALADLIVDRGISAVLVLDHLSQTAQRRFVADFCERLFDRKAEQQHRTPLHIIMDEADAFAPQKPTPDGLRTLGAVDRLVRRGRSRGIGTTAITQRPAVLAKDVLTQTEVLITLQVTAPQDRKALEEWVSGNAEDRKQAKDYLDSLGGLQRGEAWVWSPSRLQIFQQIKVRRAATFDSSYTPKVGERRPEAPTLRPVDLDQIREQLAAVVKEAAENDPKALRKRIAELEKRAEAGGYAVRTAPIGHDEAFAVVRHTVSRMVSQAIKRRDSAWRDHITQAITIGAPTDDVCVNEPGAEPVQPRPRVGRLAADGDSTLSKAERAILTALVQRHPKDSSKVQVSCLSGYSVKSSSFENALSSLNTRGLIDRTQRDGIRVTDRGITAAGTVPPMPTGRQRVIFWHDELEKAPAILLLSLADSYPTALTKQALAKSSGYSVTSSSFENALSRLASLGLAKRVNGGSAVVATDELMGDA